MAAARGGRGGRGQLWRGLLACAALLSATCSGGGPDTVVLVLVDGTTPRPLHQLLVEASVGAVPRTFRVPAQPPSDPFFLPTSFSIQIPRERRGVFVVTISALDAAGQTSTTGMATLPELDVGVLQEVTVTLGGPPTPDDGGAPPGPDASDDRSPAPADAAPDRATADAGAPDTAAADAPEPDAPPPPPPEAQDAAAPDPDVPIPTPDTAPPPPDSAPDLVPDVGAVPDVARDAVPAIDAGVGDRAGLS